MWEVPRGHGKRPRGAQGGRGHPWDTATTGWREDTGVSVGLRLAPGGPSGSARAQGSHPLVQLHPLLGLCVLHGGICWGRKGGVSLGKVPWAHTPPRGPGAPVAGEGPRPHVQEHRPHSQPPAPPSPQPPGRPHSSHRGSPPGWRQLARSWGGDGVLGGIDGRAGGGQGSPGTSYLSCRPLSWGSGSAAPAGSWESASPWAGRFRPPPRDPRGKEPFTHIARVSTSPDTEEKKTPSIGTWVPTLGVFFLASPT